MDLGGHHQQNSSSDDGSGTVSRQQYDELRQLAQELASKNNELQAVATAQQESLALK